MQGELRPHKVRYYVERRDPEFASKMAAVLHVYKEAAPPAGTGLNNL
jgi:hypothetical protein